MSNPSTLTTYATAFLASISLFGLVDAGQQDRGATVAAAITQAYLLPVLGIAAATFLAVTVIALARDHLAPQPWNRETTERAVLALGIAAACWFGLLALLGYGLALLAPGWLGFAAPALARHWPWFLAVPCLGIGMIGGRNKPAWLSGAALFVTLGLFTG
ncbi:MAG: hypothetical protein Q4615_04510 [Paracoccus aminovorans]|nr:hypothetical protein [Paracoccus aminovorans]